MKKVEQSEKKNIVKNYLFKLVNFIITLFLSFFLALFIYYSSFYVHEGGHMLFGSFDNLLNGQLPNFKISNWVEAPLFPFIKLPQQTSGRNSLNFAFGGIFTVILFSIFISYLFYKKTNNKLYLLFPLIFTYHEFFGNFLCGSDNWQNNPFSICQNWFISNAIHLVIPMLTLLISVLLYSKTSSFLNKKIWKFELINKKNKV